MPDASLINDDDDGELELEPLDPEIVAIERQRGQQQVEKAVAKVDVDELYGDTASHSDLSVDWESWKQFRFTTRHLLMGTGLLAVCLALAQWLSACTAIVVVGVTALASGWFWVIRLESRQDAERARRREEFVAAAGKPGQPAAASPASSPTEGMASATAEVLPPRPRFDFKFAFSMQELLVTTTVAAVVMGLLMWFEPERLAVVLGLLALGGLIVNAIGFDPPRVVVLTWWLLMVFYLVVGAIAAVRSDHASREPAEGRGVVLASTLD